MAEGTPRALRIALAVCVTASVVGALVLVVLQLQRAPSGPVPIVWDREVCAHCRMHVGEPAFAAQLHTAAGEVLNFDDPGCLFELARAGVDVAAVYFRHLREDRWIAAADVAFERVDRSPMGFGLGAVDLGTPGALSYDEARQSVADTAASLLEH